MRQLAVGVAIVLSVSLVWEAPAVAANPSSQVAGAKQTQRRFGVGRFFRGLKVRAMRTWHRLNRRPTRRQALAPLRQMIKSGRIGGGDVDRVKALYPELGPRTTTPRIRSSRKNPRMQPLFRLLDSGRISEAEFIRTEKALGIQ